MRDATWIWAAVGGTLGALLLGVLSAAAPARAEAGGTPATRTPGRVLDARHAWFLEDEDSRRVAALRAEIREGADGVRLRLDIRAEAPGVEPPPGWEGVAGANRISARELGRLLAEGGVEARLTRLQDGARTAVTLAAGAPRSLPVRTLGPDGRVDFEARTAEPLVPSATIDSEPLSPGRYQLTLSTEGEVRLVCGVRVGAASAAVLGLEGRARGLVRPGRSR